MQIKYSKETIIEHLSGGDDWSLREQMSDFIYEVLNKSDEGEIGWGDFIEDIRNILNNGEKLAEKYWKE